MDERQQGCAEMLLLVWASWAILFAIIFVIRQVVG